MRVIVDVMSGDHAPLAPLCGAALARDEYGVDVLLVGDEAEIRRTAEAEGIDLGRFTITHALSTIGMRDDPLSVVKKKRDSSMSIGLHMLADGEGDAFVSAGNTGALVAGASLIVRRIKGIQRAGIATVLPFPTPCLLIDSGATPEVGATHLEQFAVMGCRYFEKACGVTNPRVGLLNLGSEPEKGSEVLRDAYALLQDSGLNFVGNVEGNDVPAGACDVLVTDGFTGNVLLKFTEGIGKYMLHVMKDLFTSNALTKFAYRSIRGKVGDLKRSFNSSEYGGAPLLGIAQPVIKAHGSSDALAIKNAIGQAIRFAESGVNREIARYALDYDEEAQTRAKARAEARKQTERAEKLARKRKAGLPLTNHDTNAEEGE